MEADVAALEDNLPTPRYADDEDEDEFKLPAARYGDDDDGGQQHLANSCNSLFVCRDELILFYMCITRHR